MKPLLALAIAVVVGLLVWQGFQNRQEAVWKADRARILGEVAQRQAEGDSLRKFADGLQERAKDAERVAERNASVARGYRRVADSLMGLLKPSQTPSESLTVALGAIESLGVALDSLNAGYEARGAVIASLRDAYSAQVTRGDLLASSVDSLTALVGRAPHTSRFQPLLVLGYGATLSQGVIRTGPTVAVGIKVGL